METNIPQNPYYPFLLNMWIMRKLDENYLDAMIARNRLSEFEKDMIMATPQIPEPQV